jgi:hypothetical protein
MRVRRNRELGFSEINCPSEVIDDDSYVIHSFERPASNLHNVA